MKLKIKRLDKDIPIPSFAYDGDAGLDLSSAVDATLAPFERTAVPCGIALAIPEGYAGLLVPRSGLAAKHGISLVNGPGLIDSGYRGEIKAVLVNLDAACDFEIRKGDRIAQLVIVQLPSVETAEVDALDKTERDVGGFGSSGVHSDAK